MKDLNIITLNKDKYHDWDMFVEQSPQGDIFCYSWWLEATTNSHFKIITVIENGVMVAGIPIAYDKNGRINEPFLTRTLGVLYKPQQQLSEHKQISNQRQWLNALLEELPLNNFVQMCFHHNFTDWLPLKWKGFKQTTKYTYIIGYNGKSIEDIWNGLNNLTKRIIAKAQKNAINVEISDDIKNLYNYVLLSYQRQGLTFNISFEEFNRLDEAIKKNGKRIIFKASDNVGHIHSMLYFSFNAKSAYFLISGSDPQYREFGAFPLAMWEAIKHFYGKTEYFNFGGSVIEPIERHFRGYGGTLTPYFHIFNDNLMTEENGLRYHAKQILFHCKKLNNILVKKITGK